MKIFLAVIILIFSFQSWTKADDIRDLEIEGISIGESLLSYASVEEIESNMITNYPGSKKFSRFFKKFLQYEHTQFHFITNDKKFIIHGIEGVNYYPNNLNKCENQRKEVVEDIQKTLKTSDVIDTGKQENFNKDGSLRSETYNTYIEFDNGFLDITCINFSKSYELKNKTIADSLTISFITKELDDWLQNEAWN